MGLVFVAFPAAVGHFDLPLMWSIVFFIMILLMGLSTISTLVETIVTALLDEFSLLRTKSWWRVVVLSGVCCVLFAAGLPLTSQVRLVCLWRQSDPDQTALEEPFDLFPHSSLWPMCRKIPVMVKESAISFKLIFYLAFTGTGLTDLKYM